MSCKSDGWKLLYLRISHPLHYPSNPHRFYNPSSPPIPTTPKQPSTRPHITLECPPYRDIVGVDVVGPGTQRLPVPEDDPGVVERQDVLVAVLVPALGPLALLPAVEVLTLLLLERLELLPEAGVVAVTRSVLLLWVRAERGGGFSIVSG